MNLCDQLIADRHSVTEQIEAAGAGPILFGPARQSENESQVRKLYCIESRQAAALEVDVHAGRKRQKRFDELEPAAAPGTNGPRLGVMVFRAAQPDNLFPWFKHDADVFAGREF